MDLFWPVHRLSSDMQGNASLMDTDRRERLSSTSTYCICISVCVFGCSCMMDTCQELVWLPAFLSTYVSLFAYWPSAKTSHLCVCVFVWARTAGSGVLTWVCVTDLPRTSQFWSGLFRLAASCQQWMLDEPCFRAWNYAEHKQTRLGAARACVKLKPAVVSWPHWGEPGTKLFVNIPDTGKLLLWSNYFQTAQLGFTGKLKACIVCLHGGLFIPTLPAT